MDRSSSKRPQSRTTQKGPRLPPPEPSNRLYVAFLPSEIQESQLNTMFSKCGKVSQISLKAKDDGFTFAYITFQSTEQAQKGIEEWNKTKMGQKSLMVKYANPPQQNQGKTGFKKRDFSDHSNRGGFGFKKDFTNNKRFQKSSFGARGRGKPFDRGNNDRGFKEHSNDRGEGKPRGSHNPNFKPRSQGFDFKKQRDFKGSGRGGFNGKDKKDYQKRRNDDEKTEYGEDSKIPRIGQT